jgi:hypothetical protein
VGLRRTALPVLAITGREDHPVLLHYVSQTRDNACRTSWWRQNNSTTNPTQDPRLSPHRSKPRAPREACGGL